VRLNCVCILPSLCQPLSRSTVCLRGPAWCSVMPLMLQHHVVSNLILHVNKNRKFLSVRSCGLGS